MTRQQATCLSFITRYVSRHGYSPTYDEIQEHLGLASKSGVARIIYALEQRGFVRRRPNCARSVEIVGGGDAAAVADAAIEMARVVRAAKAKIGETLRLDDMRPIIEAVVRDALDNAYARLSADATREAA